MSQPSGKIKTRGARKLKEAMAILRATGFGPKQTNEVGLVFVTAFETRTAMGRFLSQISWETEVWIAEDPDHVVHFDGERFLGPYPDTLIG